MFHNLFVKIASLIVAGLIGLGLYSTSIIENKIQQNLGADTTLPIAGITYTLSGSGISGSATSIGLSSLTIPQTGREIVDADLSSTFYITLEPGSRTRQEIVSCTTVSQSGSDNTATLSDCTRGLLPFTPYTASSTYQFAHAGGSSVVFSNPPQLYNEFTSKGNDETITGIWSFPEPTTASSTATKNYADNLSFAGVSDSSLTQKGIVEMANKTEMANGSSTGGTTAPLFVPAQYFNATSSATSTVPVSGSNGKLSSGFIDQTANYTWSGTTVFSGNVSSTGSNSFATTSVQGVNVGSHLSKFGGDGSDGALNIANGTSTITLTSPITIKNYTSISITGGALAFTPTSTNGYIVILKSQGACTLTSASSTMIDLRNMGSGGGANALSSGSGVPPGGSGGASAINNGVAGTNGSATDQISGSSGSTFIKWLFGTQITAGLGGNAAIAGAAGVTPNYATSTAQFIKAFVLPGSGASGGSAANGTATRGGQGAGALYIECGGALNFSGTINASGESSEAGTGGGANGGGGGGGSVVILYGSLTANTGTITTSGGVAATTGGTAGGNGGAGFSLVAQNTEF